MIFSPRQEKHLLITMIYHINSNKLINTLVNDLKKVIVLNLMDY
jgi:hypothetical protein